MSPSENWKSFLLTRRVYDLGQVMAPGMHLPELSFQYLLHRRHSDPGIAKNSDKTASSGIIIMPDHSGTHIDGLTHIAYKMKLYGGIDVRSIESYGGYSKFGIEQIDPIVVPGSLIDLTKILGDPLPPRYSIKSDDLRDFVNKFGSQDSEKSGDCVLIRTGYDRLWSEPKKYADAPGLSKEATKWLVANYDAKIVGIDNASWDLYGDVDPETGMLHVGHYVLLVERGIPIVENLNLCELAKDDCYSFAFVCLPLKIRGATGSPVRPIAISY